MTLTKTTLLVIAFFLGFSSATASSPSGSEALIALKKLETRCETGISYRDYSSALAEAKFPVRMFVESENATNHPDVAAIFDKAVRHYEFAGKLWNAKFTAASDDRLLSGGFIHQKGALGLLIKETYPEAPMMNKFYPLDLMLPFVWGKASNELIEATKLLATAGGDDADKLKAENEKMRVELELEQLRRENEDLKMKMEQRKNGEG